MPGWWKKNRHVPCDDDFDQIYYTMDCYILYVAHSISWTDKLVLSSLVLFNRWSETIKGIVTKDALFWRTLYIYKTITWWTHTNYVSYVGSNGTIICLKTVVLNVIMELALSGAVRMFFFEGPPRCNTPALSPREKVCGDKNECVGRFAMNFRYSFKKFPNSYPLKNLHYELALYICLAV